MYTKHTLQQTDRPYGIRCNISCDKHRAPHPQAIFTCMVPLRCLCLILTINSCSLLFFQFQNIQVSFKLMNFYNVEK